MSKETKNPKTDDSLTSVAPDGTQLQRWRTGLSDEMANMCAKYRIYKIEQDRPEDKVTHPSSRKYWSLLAL